MKTLILAAFLLTGCARIAYLRNECLPFCQHLLRQTNPNAVAASEMDGGCVCGRLLDLWHPAEKGGAE